MTYFNTTDLAGATLDQAVKKATDQDHEVYEIFKSEKLELGASDIHFRFMNKVKSAFWIRIPFETKQDYQRAMNAFKTPITSIRRSIDSLKKLGLIVEVGQQQGIYDRPEKTYKLI